MTMTDPLGDMLTRIRNAQMRQKSKVATPASKLRARVLDVLQKKDLSAVMRKSIMTMESQKLRLN